MSNEGNKEAFNFWEGFDGTSLKPSKQTNSIHLLWLWSVSVV